MDDQIVIIDVHMHAARAQHRRGRGQPVALLDPQFRQAAQPRHTARESTRHRQNRILVDHARRPRRRHIHRNKLRKFGHQVADALAALGPGITHGQRGAHFPQRLKQPGAQRIQPDAIHHHPRSRYQQRRHHRKRRGGRIARHRHVRAPQFRLPHQPDQAPRTLPLHRHRRTEMPQHVFGMVARRLRLLDHCNAARVQPRQQQRGFYLRRGDGKTIRQRQRIPRALNRHRQPLPGPR